MIIAGYRHLQSDLMPITVCAGGIADQAIYLSGNAFNHHFTRAITGAVLINDTSMSGPSDSLFTPRWVRE
jgi:hypothetical protein